MAGSSSPEPTFFEKGEFDPKIDRINGEFT
jgi:hypothetical protein